MHQETDMTTIINMLRTAAASISETASSALAAIW